MTGAVIRVVDFETCGMEPPAEVVEVGYCDLVQTDALGWQVENPVSWLCGVQSIPPETRAVHHISMADVAGLEPFNREALFEEEGTSAVAVIAAHSMAFEEQWLQADGLMPTLCTLKAALRVWPDAPGHSNSVLRYWLEDQGLLSLDHDTAMPPHRAGPDAYVTAHILKALFAAGATGKEMVAWTRLPRLMPKITFGKHKGAQWHEAPADYLSWVATKSDLDADTKWNADQELQRRRMS